MVIASTIPRIYGTFRLSYSYDAAAAADDDTINPEPCHVNQNVFDSLA